MAKRSAAMRSRQRPFPMTPKRIQLRALAAVILPVAVVLLWRQGYVGLMHTLAEERSATAYVFDAAVIALLFLEGRWLVCLGRFVRARGRTEVFLARERDPIVFAARRRFRLRMASVSLSALGAFTLCEIVFRVFNIVPPPTPPTMESEWATTDDSVNILGIRETWDSLPDSDPRLRIAFLGDSMTYGANMPRDVAYPRVVESMLADDRPEGIMTINIGYPATDPGWQLERFRPLRDTLHPDVVIQQVFPNDLGIRMDHRLDEIYRIRDDDLWVGTLSYVLRFAERQIRYRLAWRRTIDYFRGGSTSAERAAAWAKFRHDLRASKAYIEGGGARYGLVLFPWLVKLDHYLLLDIHEEMALVARELDVPYLDLLDTFVGHDAERVRVSMANAHPNAAGHRLAAERITRFLREEVLPDVPAR